MKRVVCFCVVLCFLLVPFNVGAVSTSAKSAILINADTGEVIYEQNAREKLPMASTTKIMTALLLCETGDMDKQITVTAEMVRVEGTSMGLLAGDKVSYKALLYGMLLSSGNDAANVTAYALGGTIDGFVKMMNQKAEELGLHNTHFQTPSGLDGDEHYTTAEDLANLARVCMQNELFAKAAASKTAVLEYGNPPYRRTLTNHNKLLKTFDGAIGVKTGFTKKSGRCLVSAAERDSKRVIAVTLKDPDDWADHTALLNYGLEQIKTTKISPETEEYSVPVVASREKSIKLKIEDFTVNSLDGKGFSYKINIPMFLYAPIEKGEKIGDIVYLKNGEVIAKRDITAQKRIERISEKKDFKREFKNCFKEIFMCIWEN